MMGKKNSKESVEENEGVCKRKRETLARSYSIGLRNVSKLEGLLFSLCIVIMGKEYKRSHAR